MKIIMEYKFSNYYNNLSYLPKLVNLRFLSGVLGARILRTPIRMVLALAALAPKILIPSFFIAHKVRNEKKTAKILDTIAFTVMFAATVIILFQDKMPWIALITSMSAVFFYQRAEGAASQTVMIYALSLAIMGLTCVELNCSILALMGVALYAASYFTPPAHPEFLTIGHVLGLLAFSYGVHDPSFMKEIAAIGEHLS